jgi:hypothetical protein
LFDDLAGLIDDMLQLAAHGPSPDAAGLRLLLKCYRATERADVRAALETALGAALAQPLHRLPQAHRATYLTAFAEAMPLAADERVRAMIDTLIDSIRAEWGGPAPVGDASCAIEACLRGASAIDAARAVAPAAIDELERVIGGAYRPGDGLARDADGSGPRGELDAHVGCASALLTAFELTARLQYGMLAEELMQFALRTSWGPDRPFDLSCRAAVVLCRLSRLHDDDSYRAAAVIADGADYHADAGRVLDALSARLSGAGFERAEYGLALNEWLGGS